MEDTSAQLNQSQQPAVDGLDAFKQAFRRLAAGVSVVTARGLDSQPVGFTATSLASLAAVPPLASFNMSRVSSAWPAIADTDHVLIHMLGVRNRELAARMAGPKEDRFDGDHWAPGPRDLPLLNDVTAWMLGRIVGRHAHHGNAVIVVQIEDGALGKDDEAVLYHERRYQRAVPLD